MKIKFKNPISINGVYGKVHDIDEQAAKRLVDQRKAEFYKETETANPKSTVKTEIKTTKGEEQ